MARLIGVDHGTRRIGVAVGDEETGIAFPRRPVRSNARAAAVIRALAEEEQAVQVVVGLPLNMDGSEGPQAAAARGFGQRLASLGLDVAYADERLTSWSAAERLAEAGRTPSTRDAIDSAAAVLILEEYLAARRRRPTRES